MARPVVGVVAEWLYDAMAPLAVDDGEATDWSLLIWCQGFGQLLDELNFIVRTGANGEPGWTPAIDPDLATTSTIAFAAQNLGLRLDPASSLTVQRNQIKDAAGIYRGTPRAIAGAVQNLGVRNVLVYERSSSNYTFVVGVFTEENFARYIGFESDDEAAEFVDLTFSPLKSFRTAGFSPYAGLSFVSLVYDEGASNRTRKIEICPVSSGDSVTVTFKLRVRPSNPDVSIRVRLGDPDISEYSESLPPLISADGSWAEYSITYLPGSGTSCWLSLINRTTDNIVLDVDDLVITSNITVATGLTEPEVTAAVKPQKPLGMLFSVYLVDPADWTWFVIGSTRYTRDVVTGFIEVTPSPYPTWQDVVDNFATWQDFIDNVPI